MSNEQRARFNFVSGTLSSSLTNVATSMSAAGLANLGVIDSTNYAAITIENEVVWVTAHTAGATTATILRNQEGTTAAAHNSGVAWQHGPTAFDLNGLDALQTVYADTSATSWTPATSYSDIGVQLTLPAGKYTVEGSGGFDTSTGVTVNYFFRLQDTTNTVTLDEGFIRGSNNSASQFLAFGTLSVTGTTVVKLQLKVDTVQGAQLMQRCRMWARPVLTIQ